LLLFFPLFLNCWLTFSSFSKKNNILRFAGELRLAVTDPTGHAGSHATTYYRHLSCITPKQITNAAGGRTS
jgi:hypothetical protein